MISVNDRIGMTKIQFQIYWIISTLDVVLTSLHPASFVVKMHIELWYTHWVLERISWPLAHIEVIACAISSDSHLMQILFL